MVAVFLKLLTAHLTADFILQSGRMAADKGSITTSLRHGAVHFLAYAVVLIPVSAHAGVLLILVMCAAIHATLDFLKAHLSGDGWRPFLFDQALHVVTLIGFAAVLSHTSWSAVRDFVRPLLSEPATWLLVSGYLGVVLGGGILVQKVTAGFPLPDRPGLANAGRFIGLLERGMILTFLLADSMEAIGLLLTAKALARYPEFKEGRSEFADYFLIGTLTSVGVAMVAGFAIRWAFRHLV